MKITISDLNERLELKRQRIAETEICLQTMQKITKNQTIDESDIEEYEELLSTDEDVESEEETINNQLVDNRNFEATVTGIATGNSNNNTASSATAANVSQQSILTIITTENTHAEVASLANTTHHDSSSISNEISIGQSHSNDGTTFDMEIDLIVDADTIAANDNIDRDENSSTDSTNTESTVTEIATDNSNNNTSSPATAANASQQSILPITTIENAQEEVETLANIIHHDSSSILNEISIGQSHSNDGTTNNRELSAIDLLAVGGHATVTNDSVVDMSNHSESSTNSSGAGSFFGFQVETMYTEIDLEFSLDHYYFLDVS